MRGEGAEAKGHRGHEQEVVTRRTHECRTCRRITSSYAARSKCGTLSKLTLTGDKDVADGLVTELRGEVSREKIEKDQLKSENERLGKEVAEIRAQLT